MPGEKGTLPRQGDLLLPMLEVLSDAGGTASSEHVREALAEAVAPGTQCVEGEEERVRGGGGAAPHARPSQDTRCGFMAEHKSVIVVPVQHPAVLGHRLLTCFPLVHPLDMPLGVCARS